MRNPTNSTTKATEIETELSSTKAIEETETSEINSRDEIERQLVQIWEEVLGIQSIGVRDNFFDLGGDSYDAVPLFTQIEKRFGKKLSMATLFKADTVEALAKTIYQEELAVDHQGLTSAKVLTTDFSTVETQDRLNGSWSSLVEIQPNGFKPRLFLIHPLGGEVLCYRQLSLYLGDDQPVYGLQPQGLDGKQPLLTRVEDMASRYIEAIKTFQPQGPYFIGGYSFGGIIAFEMAQQLHSQGEKLGTLIMIDSCRPGFWTLLPFYKRIFLHLRNFVQKGPTYFWQKIGSWCAWGISRLKHKFQFHVNVAERLPETDKHLEILSVNAMAFSEYTYKVYPGQLTLLRTEDRNRDAFFDCVGKIYDPLFGWDDVVTGGIDIDSIPGSHHSLLDEPHVRVVAEKLKFQLESVYNRHEDKASSFIKKV
ncbi:hypothetical protein WA1_28480 [Scytonema hofmannii PCC 7110]|uniref:Carrier domain-containing protein n=1 Tax=Scytonema hofmannii PCC 7110 TaxID=128403 RepID=A0A139X5C4_9CYAN|nr:thioesterase domain-containing protein [Scytonema hofmannii]KYC39907.1 hypothetical protein WA1_28480 [Scytonema hofmannii PCC 7110]